MQSNYLANSRKIIWRILLLAGAGLLLYWISGDLLNTLKPFFYATVFAYLLNPLINFLQRKGVKRGWSAFLTVLLIFLLMLFMVGLFIPSLVRDASTLLRTLRSGMQNVQRLVDNSLAWANELLGDTLDVRGDLDNISQQGIRLFSDALSKLVSSLGGLLDVLLIPVISFYLLKDKDMIFRELMALTPPRMHTRMREFGVDVHKVLSGYVKGKLLISLFVGLVTGVGCLIIGLPNALTIGIVAGLFDLIPYFGPWLGGILPVIIALMGHLPGKAIWVVVLIVIIQQVESSLITPRVISQHVGLHPLLVMFSVMFFGAIMGIPGMIVGVPIMAVLLALVRYSRRPKVQTDAAAPQEAAAQEEMDI